MRSNRSLDLRLYELRIWGVVEDDVAVICPRFHDDVTRVDDSLEKALLEHHVVHTLERNFETLTAK